MAGRLIYMNVPAVRPAQDESFEERRVADYLAAFSATGRPPVPCPPQPTDPTQRAALGLPPSFEPYSDVEGAGPTVNGVGANVPVAGPANPEPVAPPDFASQAFQPTETMEFGSKAFFHSLVAQPQYFGHSPEECRVQAYRMGKQVADVPQGPRFLPAPMSLGFSQSSNNLNAPPDSLQSVTSMPPYDQHCFEELRLAFLRAGRPLGSPEIIAQNAVLKLTV